MLKDMFKIKLKIMCLCREEIKIPVTMLGKKFQCPKCKNEDYVILNPGDSWYLIISTAICILIAISMGFATGLAAFVINIVSFGLYHLMRQIKIIVKCEKEKETETERVRSDILMKEKEEEMERIRSNFTPPPECAKCGEDNWELLETSPNYKSVSWKCGYCNKKVTIKQRSNSDKNRQSDRVIPKNVQTEVWRRDQGRCVECDSKENIEYDHIIPWSKGGGNTTRNIQLLCQKCNRIKSGKEPGTW